MKKFVFAVLVASGLIAGCTLSGATSKITAVTDTIKKVNAVVKESIPVLQEIQNLDYLKPDLKEKLGTVIDGIVLVQQKIEKIATSLGIDLTPAPIVVEPVIVPATTEPATTEPKEVVVVDTTKNLADAIAALKADK